MSSKPVCHGARGSRNRNSGEGKETKFLNSARFFFKRGLFLGLENWEPACSQRPTSAARRKEKESKRPKKRKERSGWEEEVQKCGEIFGLCDLYAVLSFYGDHKGVHERLETILISNIFIGHDQSLFLGLIRVY